MQNINNKSNTREREANEREARIHTRNMMHKKQILLINRNLICKQLNL